MNDKAVFICYAAMSKEQRRAVGDDYAFVMGAVGSIEGAYSASIYPMIEEARMYHKAQAAALVESAAEVAPVYPLSKSTEGANLWRLRRALLGHPARVRSR